MQLLESVALDQTTKKTDCGQSNAALEWQARSLGWRS